MASCKTCGCSLWRGNVTGFCRVHVYTDPDLLEARREVARKLSDNPDIVDRRTRHFCKTKPWIKGLKAQSADPDFRRKSGIARTNTIMAWCPPHLRDMHRMLVGQKGYKSADAKALVLEQDRREVERLRIRMGVTEEVKPAEPKKPRIVMELAPRADGTISHVGFSEIIAEISQRFDVPVDDIMGHSRLKYITQARFACFTVFYHRGSSLASIGKRMNRDHTSVLNGIRSFQKGATDEMWDAISDFMPRPVIAA